MGRKKNTPTDCQFMMAEVIKTERISPNFVRLTLAGLDGLKAWGSDQWCRLFFTRQGQDVLALPTRTTEIGWYLQYLAWIHRCDLGVTAWENRKCPPEQEESSLVRVLLPLPERHLTGAIITHPRSHIHFLRRPQPHLSRRAGPDHGPGRGPVNSTNRQRC